MAVRVRVGVRRVGLEGSLLGSSSVCAYPYRDAFCSDHGVSRCYPLPRHGSYIPELAEETVPVPVGLKSQQPVR